MDLSQLCAYPAVMDLPFAHNRKSPSRDTGVNEQEDSWALLALDPYQPCQVQDVS